MPSLHGQPVDTGSVARWAVVVVASWFAVSFGLIGVWLLVARRRLRASADPEPLSPLSPPTDAAPVVLTEHIEDNEPA